MKQTHCRFVLLSVSTVTVLAASISMASVAESTEKTVLPPGISPMTPAEAVGSDLVAKWKHDPSYGGVFVDSPSSVRLVLKGNESPNVPSVNGVTIRVQSSLHSFTELRVAAETLDKANPSSLGTMIQPDHNRLTVSVMAETLGEGFTIDRAGIPNDILVEVRPVAVPPILNTAEGGATATGNGCSTGFRYNGWMISTASHCSNNFGSVNGTAVSWLSDACTIDNQVGYGSSTSTNIQGTYFGGQGDAAWGTTIYKWGNQTGWTSGAAWYYTTSTISCDVLVQLVSGQSSVGGDSGGPVVTFSCYWEWGFCVYQARATHRGIHAGGSVMNVPISEINAYGYSVG